MEDVIKKKWNRNDLVKIELVKHSLMFKTV